MVCKAQVPKDACQPSTGSASGKAENQMEENTDEMEQWQVGKKLKFDLADLELDKWLIDLKNDKNALFGLYAIAKDVTPDRDAKLKELKKLILKK